MSNDIRTPEEFCEFMRKMADKKGLLSSFKWLWERLTPHMKDTYFKYCKKYCTDPAVMQLMRLIKEVSKFRHDDNLIIEGSIVEAFFPFSDAPDLSTNLDEQNKKQLHKTRPALVLKRFKVGKRVVVIVAKITDAGHADRSDIDIPISNPNACGLRKDSDICIYQLVTLDEKKSVIGKYGNIQDEEKNKVANLWKMHMQPDFSRQGAHLQDYKTAS